MDRKARRPAAKDKHPQALVEQIETEHEARRPRTRAPAAAAKGVASKKRGRAVDDEVEDDGEMPGVEFKEVDADVRGRMSAKVRAAARAQLEEVDADDDDPIGVAMMLPRGAAAAAAAAARAEEDYGDDSDGDGGSDGGGHCRDGGAGPASAWDMCDEDERALAAFMGPCAAPTSQVTLSEAIARRLAALPPSGLGDAGSRPGAPPPLDATVTSVYTAVGDLLSRYTHGKVPKALKIVPALADWERVLVLTKPESWSAPAMYAATKLFASNLNERLAQRFYHLVLLPRVRADVAQHRRLHFSLYRALAKALYKPGAWYKGILLPLCVSRDCTLREAVILSSILAKCSVPVLHSAAALLRIAQLPWCGVNSFFLRVLLDKRYALPHAVIDALAEHFHAVASEPRPLPVVWHQALLCFVQRYKHELTKQQQASLLATVRAQHHHAVSPEIRRELAAARCRGQPPPERAVAASAGAGANRVEAGRAGPPPAKRARRAAGAERLQDMAPMPMEDA